MYHDQALIPIKTIDFDGGVNVTLGLDIVRTSPDHGTAFDIAADFRASPSSLVAALRLAHDMGARRRLHACNSGKPLSRDDLRREFRAHAPSRPRAPARNPRSSYGLETWRAVVFPPTGGKPAKKQCAHRAHLMAANGGPRPQAARDAADDPRPRRPAAPARGDRRARPERAQGARPELPDGPEPDRQDRPPRRQPRRPRRARGRPRPRRPDPRAADGGRPPRRRDRARRPRPARRSPRSPPPTRAG